ncbi:peptide chain release factor N(5)-glutamine methyltransferase [Albibacterium sp.]|uniref:peptide chain release factor N(5)-glutamine methyltransferase n=1 Tax=Albibacterium sp. TaxID=2952885 RepID=UPI002BD41D6A|nr:peptide chain release factor N(5)-glutamine methyltransferase [Albibacterium sp.]HUH18398.1 peptide chain release factor N(5)-glutamine methyltransferase [Albibacterium sp.]
MIEIKHLKHRFISHLESNYGVDESVELFWMSMEHILQIPRLQLKMKQSIDLSDAQQSILNYILSEMQTGKPIQYILGYAWFYNQKFAVNESVLIPRPETEELVSLILNENSGKDLRVLDIGTGSGCIPISLKKNLPEKSKVIGVDISEDALNVARLNADKLACVVDFFQMDILKEISLLNTEGKFDVIVSNPPYITPKEKRLMHNNVLKFEPHIALFVEESNPLVFYNAIADFAIKNLNQNGRLYFEINQLYGNQILLMLKEKGFQEIQMKKDISNHDRMISAILA